LHQLIDAPEEISTEQMDQMKALTTSYCKALISSFDDRFPEEEILCSFMIFDPLRCPSETQTRKEYGNKELDTLIHKFGPIVGSSYKTKVDFQSFKERLSSTEFASCSSAGQVCRILAKESFYKEMYPEISSLASIALTIPMSTAWPERGFSTLKRVKSTSRNRLLDSTLSALLSVSINGMTQLTDIQANEIAARWLHNKSRRTISSREVELETPVVSSYSNEHFIIDSEKFFL